MTESTARVGGHGRRAATEPRIAGEDPLRLCVYTTVALLAWALGPPLVVAWMGGLGTWAYLRARRGGLLRSRCWLRDTRLVIAYLGVAFLGGATVAILDLLRRFG